MNSYLSSSEIKTEISVIVPIYNEVTNIEPLVILLLAELVVRAYYESSNAYMQYEGC